MLYFRDEGQSIKNGFNFYPLTSSSSAGVILRIKNNTWRIRYSKITKQWHVGKSKL